MTRPPITLDLVRIRAEAGDPEAQHVLTKIKRAILTGKITPGEGGASIVVNRAGDIVSSESVEGEPTISVPSDVDHARTLAFICENHLNAHRVAPSDDPLDHDGAQAALGFYHAQFGEAPGDAATDPLVARVVFPMRLARDEMRIVQHLTKSEAREAIHHAATAVIEPLVERFLGAVTTAAAWARDGFLTFDLTQGLYDLLSGPLDPGVAATPAVRAVSPHRAFALRLPGPNYPRILSVPIRAIIVQQSLTLREDQLEEAWKHTRALFDAQKGLGKLLADCDRLTDAHPIIRDAFAAARAFVPATDEVATSALFLGPSKATIVQAGQFHTAVGGYSGTETIGTIIGEHRFRAADDPLAEDSVLVRATEASRAVYEKLIQVAYGAILYLANVDGGGEKRRGREVRLWNGKKVRADARLLGRGVKP